MANSADPVQNPTDLDLHCLQRQDISEFSMTRINDLNTDGSFTLAESNSFLSP